MTDARPNPDELLAHVQKEEAKAKRGKLKIFFGAAPGVGKTYAMLEAARKQAKAGVDVVVGYLEPHVRPETMALVLGLEILPRSEIDYRNVKLFEFDLAGALARKPEILILDELAHTNASAPDAVTHAKRWQDALQVLEEGINVYATLNVQHLESLNDVVARVTGVVVRETVPDSVFEAADEVELVDLPPDDLIDRMKEGKVYLGEQANLARERFFRKGNLIALRELALRATAERVNAQMEDYRALHAVSRIWPTSERLMVCVGPSPFAAKLIRATRRMASSLRAPWIAVHVETINERRLSDSSRERIEQNLHFAEQLGGETASFFADDLIRDLVDFAHRRNVSKIIVGKPRQPLLRDLLRGSFVYNLTRKCGDIDIYVISGEATDEAERQRASDASEPVAAPARYFWSILAVALTTVIGYGLFPFFSPPNLVMIFLLATVAVAQWLGRGPASLTALLSVLAFDFFFVPPYYTFAVSNSEYLLTFGAMLITGLVISALAARARERMSVLRARERKTVALYNLSRDLSAARIREKILSAAIHHISTVVEGQPFFVLPDPEERVRVWRPDQGRIELAAYDRGVAQWVMDHGRSAGLGTDTLPGATAIYIPMKTADEVVGVLGVRPPAGRRFLDSEQLRLLDTSATLTAIALQRVHLARDAEKAMVQAESERLRNALLSAVSHDLRTPMTAIIGAGATLRDDHRRLDEESRRELAETVVEEAERLNRLVGNLLDMTRLDAGSIVVHRERTPLEEIVGVALRQLSKRLRGRPVRAQLPTDLPMVNVDAILIEQVFVNLLDNAIKYTPAGTPIDISARKEENAIVVEVADRGPGLKPGDEQRVFEKFFQASDGRRGGFGLGLAICKGIIQIHGGAISARNRPEGGVLIRFTLPCDPEPPTAQLVNLAEELASSAAEEAKE